MKCKVKRVFFSISVFFHEHSRFTGQQGKGKGIHLAPLYHFHPLQGHIDIQPGHYYRELTSAHSYQPSSNQEPLVSKRKSLTAEPRTLVKRVESIKTFSTSIT